MHVQMFTQQHLRMQGKIDTIVLRTVERAIGGGVAMGYSWGVGVGPARAERRSGRAARRGRTGNPTGAAR